MRKRLVASVFLFFLSLGVAAAEPSIELTIAAFNDFHGHLEPPAGAFGGVDALAAHIDALRRERPHTVVVSAGDLIGASPLVSGYFRDEPTIEAMNRLGLDFNAVGNHEFDAGAAELLRLQQGGCHPSGERTCMGEQVGTPVPFEGARFAFLAANVVERGTDQTLLPAYVVRRYGGVPVAFIGLTLRGTAGIVRAEGIAGLRFQDEARTVNRLVETLRGEGIKAIAVLLHEGGRQAGAYDECRGVSGPIVDIVRRLADDVDLVVTGHTHQAYNCRLRNSVGREVLVTSAGSYGRYYTRIDLRLDASTGDVRDIAARNIEVRRDGRSNAEVAQLVRAYAQLAEPYAQRVAGHITQDYTRELDAAGQSALGQLSADAQLEATRAAGAVAAFMNMGGLRADLRYRKGGGRDAGAVTYGDVYAVHPFGNALVTLTLTGAQIRTLLEQQFGCPGIRSGRLRPLQVSRGVEYAWDPGAPPCERVATDSIRLNGAPLSATQRYRVTVNSYLADGGDGLRVLREGVEREAGVLDRDALASYLQHQAAAQAVSAPRVRLAPAAIPTSERASHHDQTHFSR